MLALRKPLVAVLHGTHPKVGPGYSLARVRLGRCSRLEARTWPLGRRPGRWWALTVLFRRARHTSLATLIAMLFSHPWRP